MLDIVLQQGLALLCASCGVWSEHSLMWRCVLYTEAAARQLSTANMAKNACKKTEWIDVEVTQIALE